MNLTRWTALIFVFQFALLIGATQTASAQTKVAIVDIGLIFKSHPRFSTSLAELRAKADQFKAESQQLQQQLIGKAERLSLYEKDSEAYRDQEALLAKETATMEVEQRSKMRDLLKQEAKLHFDTYLEISDYVGKFCDEYGIQLVLRFNSEEMNPKQPQTITSRVNGGVVYHSRSADITNEIIKRIAQSPRQAAGVGATNR